MLLYFLLNLILDTDIFVTGILGGYEIKIEDAPYQINYGDVCGGALIHKKWAITSAHCGSKKFIRVGVNDRLGHRKAHISKHIVHPLFSKAHEFDYDIQLLKLNRRLRLTKSVQTIKISDGYCGKYILISGWGYPEERGEYQDKLHQVKQQLVPMKECQRIQQPWYNNTLTERMFCAGGSNTSDACQGDSGGGAVSSGLLVGISSFGYGCGRDVPGVYINVSDANVRKWIAYHTGI